MSLPDGFDENDYYYVDWYTYAYISGNTYFNINVKDAPLFNQPVDKNNINVKDAPLFNQPVDKNDPKKGVYADGIVLGGDIPGGKVSDDGKTYSAEGVFSGYRGPGSNFYYHTYTAYPKSQFKDQSSGTLLLPYVYRVPEVAIQRSILRHCRWFAGYCARSNEE